MDHKIVDFIPNALYLSPMIHDLDVRGLLCPLPVLKVRKRLKDLARGDVLRMHADDPAARIDVPHFCNESGAKFSYDVFGGAAAVFTND